jgi:molybdate transport system substrate-binding protein
MKGFVVTLLSLLTAVIGAACDSKSPTVRPVLTVYAAASTTEAITEAAKNFEQSRGVAVTTNFGSSSMLAKQIMGGARADIFLSADEEWMDELSKAGMIQDGTRVDLLANTLVLVAPKGKTLQVKMSKDFDLAAALPKPGRIALGDPSHVPAGRYAQQALESLGWWPALKDRILPGQDVRATLRLVELGEADAGVVYATDAKVSQKVEVIAIFPEGTHAPIRYPIAAWRNAGPEASNFIAFLRSPEGARFFTDRGFTIAP